MKAEIVRAEEAAKEAEAVRDKTAAAIGNLVHDSVPVSNDEVQLCTVCTAHHTPHLSTSTQNPSIYKAHEWKCKMSATYLQ